MNLREWLDEECIEVKQFASKMGVNIHSVHNWLNYGVIPLRLHRALIQKLTKGQVKIEEWENGQKTVNKRLRSGGDHELHDSKRVADDKTTKSKSSKKRR